MICVNSIFNTSGGHRAAADTCSSCNLRLYLVVVYQPDAFVVRSASYLSITAEGAAPFLSGPYHCCRCFVCRGFHGRCACGKSGLAILQIASEQAFTCALCGIVGAFIELLRVTLLLRYNLLRLFGDGWGLVVPAAFKAVVRRAERLGCVRFARISAKKCKGAQAGSFLFGLLFRASALSCSIDGRLRCGLGVTVVLFVLHCLP